MVSRTNFASVVLTLLDITCLDLVLDEAVPNEPAPLLAAAKQYKEDQL